MSILWFIIRGLPGASCGKWLLDEFLLRAAQRDESSVWSGAKAGLGLSQVYLVPGRFLNINTFIGDIKRVTWTIADHWLVRENCNRHTLLKDQYVTLTPGVQNRYCSSNLKQSADYPAPSSLGSKHSWLAGGVMLGYLKPANLLWSKPEPKLKEEHIRPDHILMSFLRLNAVNISHMASLNPS